MLQAGQECTEKIKNPERRGLQICHGPTASCGDRPGVGEREGLAPMTTLCARPQTECNEEGHKVALQTTTTETTPEGHPPKLREDAGPGCARGCGSGCRPPNPGPTSPAAQPSWRESHDPSPPTLLLSPVAPPFSLLSLSAFLTRIPVSCDTASESTAPRNPPPPRCVEGAMVLPRSFRPCDDDAAVATGVYMASS